MAKKQPAPSPRKTKLADIARSVHPANKSWLDEVTSDERADILSVCRDIIAGKIIGSHRAIADAWAAEGVPVTRHKLDELISKVRRGVIQ